MFGETFDSRVNLDLIRSWLNFACSEDLLQLPDAKVGNTCSNQSCVFDYFEWMPLTYVFGLASFDELLHGRPCEIVALSGWHIEFRLDFLSVMFNSTY